MWLLTHPWRYNKSNLSRFEIKKLQYLSEPNFWSSSKWDLFSKVIPQFLHEKDRIWKNSTRGYKIWVPHLLWNSNPALSNEFASKTNRKSAENLREPFVEVLFYERLKKERLPLAKNLRKLERSRLCTDCSPVTWSTVCTRWCTSLQELSLRDRYETAEVTNVANAVHRIHGNYGNSTWSRSLNLHRKLSRKPFRN